MATISERDIIKSGDVPTMIAGAIEGQLAKFTEFANPSLCYYGIQLKYTLEITTFSRGEKKVLAIKDEMLRAHDEAPPIPSDAVADTVSASGMKMAGRRSPGPKHLPVEGTVVVPSLPPVKSQAPLPQRSPVME